MINLEQVKLLEKRVSKAVDYIERLTKENATLHQREAELQAKLDTNQKRIDELEVLVLDFKEDQGQIEEGILAALDRLSQFEKAIEKSLKDKPAGAKNAKEPKTHTGQAAEARNAAASAAGETCFEIPEDAAEDDIPDPLDDTANADVELPSEDGEQAGELEIF